ncbi:MAG: DJ-1/PfpI family protein [Bacteroidota bacterium]
MRHRLGIFLFNEVEVLDFAGPFEVFAVADQIHDYQHFEVFTFAQSREPIRAVNGLSVNPDYAISEVSELDILLVPGGDGSKALLQDQELMDLLAELQSKAELTASICSGARVLAKWGLLDGKPYCTHHAVYADLAKLAPSGVPKPDLRFTGGEGVYTAAGIAAGIDLSLHLVGLLKGEEVAETTARYMEYPYR